MKTVNKLGIKIGCKTSIWFTIENSEWKVTSFSIEHNHELARTEQRQFLKLNRKNNKCVSLVLKDEKVWKLMECLHIPLISGTYVISEHQCQEDITFCNH